MFLKCTVLNNGLLQILNTNTDVCIAQQPCNSQTYLSSEFQWWRPAQVPQIHSTLAMRLLFLWSKLGRGLGIVPVLLCFGGLCPRLVLVAAGDSPWPHAVFQVLLKPWQNSAPFYGDQSESAWSLHFCMWSCSSVVQCILCIQKVPWSTPGIPGKGSQV